MNIFIKYKNFYKKKGLIKTLIKIITKPLRFLVKRNAYKNFTEAKKKNI